MAGAPLPKHVGDAGQRLEALHVQRQRLARSPTGARCRPWAASRYTTRRSSSWADGRVRVLVFLQTIHRFRRRSIREGADI
jgi:hypothetical protein